MVPAVLAVSSSKAHLPKWERFRARAHGPVSGQLYETIGGGLINLVRFPVAFRPPAFVSWESWSPARDLASVTSGLPPTQRGEADPDGVSAFRTYETRGWGWVPPVPRGRRCPHGRAQSLAAACRLPTAGPCYLGAADRPRMCN